jgi:hypothetical protein
MDWSNIWYDSMPGESHLLIAQDSEHSLATGIPELVPALTNMLSSVAHGHTVRRPIPSWSRSVLAEIYRCHACSDHAMIGQAAHRPTFRHRVDNATGRIDVTVPPEFKPRSVKLWHAETL